MKYTLNLECDDTESYEELKRMKQMLCIFDYIVAIENFKTFLRNIYDREFKDTDELLEQINTAFYECIEGLDLE